MPKLQGRTLPMAGDYRFSFCCQKDILTALRKQLFWDFHHLGIQAKAFELFAAADADSVCLAIQVRIGAEQRAALQRLAANLQQHAAIDSASLQPCVVSGKMAKVAQRARAAASSLRHPRDVCYS